MKVLSRFRRLGSPLALPRWRETACAHVGVFLINDDYKKCPSAGARGLFSVLLIRHRTRCLSGGTACVATAWRRFNCLLRTSTFANTNPSYLPDLGPWICFFPLFDILNIINNIQKKNFLHSISQIKNLDKIVSLFLK